MAHNVSWDDLRILRAVATTGSVSAAARALGLNHATVLRRVASFEERRGITLFHRSRLGYRVDPRAASLIEAIADVETAVDRVNRLIEGERDALAGPYVVTTTDSLALTVLPRHVASFLDANPELDLTLVSTNVRMDLGRLDAEATIRPARELPAELHGERVGTLRFHVYGSPSYVRRLGSKESSDCCWLGISELLSRSPPYAWQSSLPQDAIRMRADSFPTLAAAARAGLGLCMLPSILADGLERAPAFDDELATGLWVAAHADLASTPRVAALLRWFERALIEDPAINS